MAADIYTKGLTDKNTFGNLKQLINVFKPQQIESGDFDPSIPGDPVPPGVHQWLNQHYHFLLAGDNTEVTDFRKPIKPKTPKAKSKLKIRPNFNRPFKHRMIRTWRMLLTRLCPTGTCPTRADPKASVRLAAKFYRLLVPVPPAQ